MHASRKGKQSQSYCSFDFFHLVGWLVGGKRELYKSDVELVITKHLESLAGKQFFSIAILHVGILISSGKKKKKT